jgi:hypothetical protein
MLLGGSSINLYGEGMISLRSRRGAISMTGVAGIIMFLLLVIMMYFVLRPEAISEKDAATVPVAAQSDAIVDVTEADFTKMPDEGVKVDLKINGSDTLLILDSNSSYTYKWTSRGATFCEQISPSSSGIAMTGESGEITAGHPFYPKPGKTITFIFQCENKTKKSADTVTVSVR